MRFALNEILSFNFSLSDFPHFLLQIESSLASNFLASKMLALVEARVTGRLVILKELQKSTTSHQIALV